MKACLPGALDPDPAPWLDDVPGDRQSQARALCPRHPFRDDVQELIEDPGLELRGDADAGIRDAHPEKIASPDIGFHLDPPALGGELYGIAQEIDHDLLDLIDVHRDKRQGIPGLGAQAQALFVGQELDFGQGMSQDRTDVRR
jgi:hypothetical protein